MSSKNQAATFSNFRYRKIVHYFLILCILLIQIILAGFFYNEFMNKKNLAFIEKQLNEISSLENLTNDSRKELLISQDHFQKYLITNDKKTSGFVFRICQQAHKKSRQHQQLSKSETVKHRLASEKRFF